MLRTYLTILGCAVALLGGATNAADTPPSAQTRGNAAPQHQELEAILGMADQGDAGSQNYLGFLYATGQTVAKDEKLAFSWFQKAAAQGHPEAIGNLAMMYEKGLGVAKNFQTALSLHRQAAMAGYPISMKRLATLYETGAMGEERDPIKAEMWKNRYKETMRPSAPETAPRQSATTPQGDKGAVAKPVTVAAAPAKPASATPPAATPSAPAATDKPYYFQISGKATARETLDVIQKIVEKNLLPQNKKIELLNPDGKSYRINVGPFTDAKEATPYKTKIAALLTPAPPATVEAPAPKPAVAPAVAPQPAAPPAPPVKTAAAPSAAAVAPQPATAAPRPANSPIAAPAKPAAPAAAAPTVAAAPAAEKPVAVAPKPAVPATAAPTAVTAPKPATPAIATPTVVAAVAPAVAVAPKPAAPVAATPPQAVIRPAEKPAAAAPLPAAKPAPQPSPAPAATAAAPSKPAAQDAKKPQFIEVSGKTSAHEATELIQKIVEKGLLPKNMQIELVNPEADHYRVRIGPFADGGSAAPQIAKIKASVANVSTPVTQELVPASAMRPPAAPPQKPAPAQPVAAPIQPAPAPVPKSAAAVAAVPVKAAEEKTPAAAQPAAKVVRDRYYFIQLNAKNTFEDSMFLTQFLFMKNLVQETRRVKIENLDKQSFRVSLGPFSDAKEAHQHLQKINQQTFLKSSIVTVERQTPVSGEGDHELFIQINAQGTLDNAVTLTQSLMEKELLAPKMFAEMVNFGTGNYRVRYGPFKGTREAGQSIQNLKKQLQVSPILVNLERLVQVDAKSPL